MDHQNDKDQILRSRLNNLAKRYFKNKPGFIPPQQNLPILPTNSHNIPQNTNLNYFLPNYYNQQPVPLTTYINLSRPVVPHYFQPSSNLICNDIYVRTNKNGLENQKKNSITNRRSSF